MLSHSDFRLRPMTASDLELVLQWRNSDRVRNNMYTDHIIRPEEHRAWFEKVSYEKRSLHFVFEYLGKPVGVVNINQIDRTNNKCSWGFYIGENNLPKGCGSAMGFFALDHLFSSLGFRKVIGEVFAFNEDSMRFHKRLGFVEEGRLLRHLLKNGVFQDVVTLAIFDTDWHRVKPTLVRNFFDKDAVTCEK